PAQLFLCGAAGRQYHLEAIAQAVAGPAFPRPLQAGPGPFPVSLAVVFHGGLQSPSGDADPGQVGTAGRTLEVGPAWLRDIAQDPVFLDSDGQAGRLFGAEEFRARPAAG